MSRPKHKIKEIEQEFRKMEQADWVITGGGDRHYKLKCPEDCKCMLVAASTPGGRNPTLAFTAQRSRVTCWKEE